METTIPVKVQPLSPDAFRPWAGAGKSSAPLSRGRGRAVLRGDAPTETAPQTSGTTSCWDFLRDCRGWDDHGRHPRDSAPAYKERTGTVSVLPLSFFVVYRVFGARCVFALGHHNNELVHLLVNKRDHFLERSCRGRRRRIADREAFGLALVQL